jgi:3-(3-hydroxy-phenyl)propionate hydroxylase
MPDDPITTAPLRVNTAVTGGHYELPVYPFVEPGELRGALGRHPVAIVGAGLTGLTLACDLALRGIPAVVLDEDDTVGVRGASSRGICYAQKSLEIFERLGIYQRMLDKGIQWSVGRTYAGDDEVYSFDLKRQRTHDASEQPAFINLQQFYVEWFLVDRLYELGTVELRWRNRVVGIEPHDDEVRVEVETPHGHYRLSAAWLVDCTGSHSPVRKWTNVAVLSDWILDRWCISDVRFRQQPVAERWTWIEAPFNENRAVWQHLMADRVWRLDYQMPADADPDAISRPEVVAERLRRQFGADIEYELVWVGPYAYRSECLERFRAGRVLFAGDAAHVMSPFGARGGNSGIQDADNLGWKLALVLAGAAPEQLLDSYDEERRGAAHENIRITRRTTRFLSPPTANEHLWRQAVIGLAREYPFARAFVNTGRLSSPTHYTASKLNAGAGGGRPVQNVALILPDGRRGNLITLLEQSDGVLLGLLFGELDGYFARELEALEGRYPVRFIAVQADEGATSTFATVIDADGRLAQQAGAMAGDFALLRPDLHLAGTLEEAGAGDIERALRIALATDPK